MSSHHRPHGDNTEGQVHPRVRDALTVTDARAWQTTRGRGPAEDDQVWAPCSKAEAAREQSLLSRVHVPERASWIHVSSVPSCVLAPSAPGVSLLPTVRTRLCQVPCPHRLPSHGCCPKASTDRMSQHRDTHIFKKEHSWGASVAPSVERRPLVQVKIPGSGVKPRVRFPAQWKDCFPLPRSPCLCSLALFVSNK